VYRSSRTGITGIIGIVLGFATVSLRSEEPASETVRATAHPAYINYVFQPYQARLRLDDGTERIAERKPAEFHRGDDRAVSQTIVVGAAPAAACLGDRCGRG